MADRAIIQKNFRLRLATLERFLDPARHRRLLEVGCAYGFFLDLARGRFETATGIDITEDGVRYARETLGLDAVQGDLLDPRLRRPAVRRRVPLGHHRAPAAAGPRSSRSSPASPSPARSSR